QDPALSVTKGEFGGEMRRKIDKVEVVDQGAVIVHFKTPYPAFIDCLGKLLGIIPKSYVEKMGDAGFSKTPIGAGPFKAVKFKQDVFFEFEAVDNHYRKSPNVKHFRYLNVPENQTRIAMLTTDEVDVCHLPYGTFYQVRDNPKYRVVYSKNAYVASLAYYDLAHPDRKSPFKDVRVRKAAALAIDRKMICEKVLHGLHDPGGSFIAPYTIGYDPSVPPHPYDPKQAKALLKEAGYPNGFDIEIQCPPQYKTETQAIAANLNAVGIRAKVVVPEAGIRSRMVRSRKATGLARHPGPWWMGRRHPAAALDHFSDSATWCFYTTPEIDKAMMELGQMTDEKEITKKVRQITKKYAEEYIRAPLWVVNVPYGLGPRVKYWEQTPGWLFAVNFEFLELKE
ncbi:ABC transporter substrate-binding protein, partial [Thermodesulfobacteriota bacterium]